MRVGSRTVIVLFWSAALFLFIIVVLLALCALKATYR